MPEVAKKGLPLNSGRASIWFSKMVFGSLLFLRDFERFLLGLLFDLRPLLLDLLFLLSGEPACFFRLREDRSVCTVKRLS